MPYRDLGVIKNATKEAMVNLEFEDEKRHGKSIMPLESYPNCESRILKSPETKYFWKIRSIFIRQLRMRKILVTQLGIRTQEPLKFQLFPLKEKFWLIGSRNLDEQKANSGGCQSRQISGRN